MNLEIYEFHPKTKSVVVFHPISLLEFTGFDGLSMKDNWKIPRYKMFNKSRPIKDFISFQVGRTIIFSENARHSLEYLIGKYVEFLPFVELKKKQYFFLNVLNIVDCLDKKRTKIHYVQDRIICLDYIHFIKKRLPNSPIFKIPESMSYIFVRQSFIDAIINNNLTGAIFFNPDNKEFSKWEETSLKIRGLIY